MSPQEFELDPESDNWANMHVLRPEHVSPEQVEPAPASEPMAFEQGDEESVVSHTDDTEIIDPETVEPEAREGWWKRNLTKLCLGGLAVGTAVSLITSPYQQILDKLKTSAPWVASAGIATEGLFIGGIAMMALSAGIKIGNPFTLRSRFKEISQEATDSLVFRAGFVINAVGALATAGVVAAGVVSALPTETWPSGLVLAGADIVGTVALRAGLIKGNKNARERAEGMQ